MEAEGEGGARGLSVEEDWFGDFFGEDVFIYVGFQKAGIDLFPLAAVRLYSSAVLTVGFKVSRFVNQDDKQGVWRQVRIKRYFAPILR